MADHLLVTIDPKQVADLKRFVREELAKERADAAVRQRREVELKPVGTHAYRVVQPDELQKLRQALVALAAELERGPRTRPEDDFIDQVALRIRELAR